MRFLVTPPPISGGQNLRNTTGSNPRLITAARQFEASLMQELLKPLQNKSALFTDEGAEADNSGDALASFGSEALAQAISNHGGLGIANRILGTLSRQTGP